MDAIVLVGGEGTRLRPLTYDLPKQMLPVVDRPMIEHVVGWLAQHGVERVVLSLGYRPDEFQRSYPEGELAGARLMFAVEPELLDTAGAVRFAAEAAGLTERCLVLNGDVLSDFDISGLVSFHEGHGGSATIELTPVEDPSAFGVVPTDQSGKVTAFIEKPPPGTAPTNQISAGCYLLEHEVIASIPTGRRVSLERETFPHLVEEGTLFALSSEAYWLDTGTPEKYLQASRDILHRRRSRDCLPAVPEVAPGVFADPTAVIAGTVREASYLGREALVSPGGEVTDSVLSAGVEIGEGARVSGSLLMTGAKVGRGSVIEDSIIGPDAVLGAGCKVTDTSIVAAGEQIEDSTTLAAARIGGR
jgi:mannose-1-phosphate guanylyltransferase